MAFGELVIILEVLRRKPVEELKNNIELFNSLHRLLIDESKGCIPSWVTVPEALQAELEKFDIDETFQRYIELDLLDEMQA